MVAPVTTPPRGWGDVPTPRTRQQPHDSAQNGAAIPAESGSPATPIPDGDAPDPSAGLALTAAPAIVPARRQPLSVGSLVDDAIEAIRRAPAVTWTFGAIVVAILGVVEIAVALAAGVLSRGLLPQQWTDQLPPDVGTEIDLLIGQTITSTLAAILGALCIALIAGLVARSVIATDSAPRIREAWAMVRPRVGGVLAIALLLVLLVAGPVAVVALLTLGAIAVAGPAVGTLVGVLAAVAAVIAVGLVAVPVVLIAGPEYATSTASIRGTLARARILVRGQRLRLVGIWLLSTIMLAIASGVTSAPFNAIGAITGSGQAIWQIIGSIAAAAVTAPIGALVLALVHHDLVALHSEGE